MKHKLPPLPPYASEFRPRWLGEPGGYSEAQMQAYATEAVNDVLAGLEASMIAADLRINDMKNTGELRKREDHAALVAQVKEQQ